MFGILLKKQLTETFRGYFYDAKKNKKRPKAAVIGFFVLFIVLMAGIMGGMFTYLSVSICKPVTAVGMDFMYFLLLGGFALILGAFGSVFNTFSSLYLSKDNDLLLSMPIPEKYIILSRLADVYVLGTMYSAVASIPAVIVYLCVTGFTAQKLICGLVYIFLITVIVFVLSCLLGWCVAKISQKLKNKSFFTTLLCVLFIVLYYVVYFKAQELINKFVANAAVYGTKIKGSAYVLYKTGCVPCGDIPAALISLAVCAVLLAASWIILKTTFLSIVTSVGISSRVKYKEKKYSVRTPFKALVSKEFSKFTSSTNYMMNCGLGVLFIPAAGIGLLIKGPDLLKSIDGALGVSKAAGAIVICAALWTLSSMNDMAAPSVSLEGKNLWIPQSLPVEPKKVLQAKTVVQLILAGIPMIFASVCAMFVLKYSPLIKVLVFVSSMVFVVFSALFSTFLGIMMPNLTWTNEIVPIKQGGAVFTAMFGSWAIAGVYALVYILIGYKISTEIYLVLWILLLAGLSIFFKKWLDTSGAKRLTEL